uniref:Uncharacterized protein n=1 Tax=Candidatus Methanogaster sp. ANME-2c ERB4 TaxID=2759911 RepID=A0A7G9YN81_9EURY|nr:hypothetical protein OCBBGKCP_00022 [Methanosarcinales archaeon ANME-2c ERB4]
MIVYVEGIDERKDVAGAGMRFFDRFYELDIDVPIAIMLDRGEMGEGKGG